MHEWQKTCVFDWSYTLHPLVGCSEIFCSKETRYDSILVHWSQTQFIFKQTSQCVELIDIVFLWMQNCQCVLNHKWKNTNPSLIKLKWPILPTWKAFIFFLCHAVYGLSVLWLWNTKFCHSCILKTPDRSFLWPPHKINTNGPGLR